MFALHADVHALRFSVQLRLWWAVSVERLIELLTHSDPDWRRQGRELMHALGGDASAQVLQRSTRENWLWPSGVGDASELVAALAESSELADARSNIRELPPIETHDERDIRLIADGFPNATLRLLWSRAPSSLEFLQELPTKSLQLSVAGGLVPTQFSPQLERLSFFGSVPELHAPGLRELEIASWTSSWFETTFQHLAPQLEKLRVLNRSGQLPVEFPKLRSLRIPLLPKHLEVASPLEELHVETTHGRTVLKHPAVGPETRIRADGWTDPYPSVAGDPRLVWIGASSGWEDRLRSLPNLEVADADESQLPSHVLPAPSMLNRGEVSDPEPALEAWAKRGRGYSLRCRTNARKIPAIKRVRTFSAFGLADAKRFVETFLGTGMVALTPYQALYWQAVLREQMPLEMDFR